MIADTISLEVIRHATIKGNGRLTANDDFVLLCDFAMQDMDFIKDGRPYRLTEGRAFVCRSGRASYAFNMVQHDIEAGDVLVMLADTMVEKIGSIAALTFDMFSFSPVSAATYLGNDAAGVLHLKGAGLVDNVVSQHIETMWQLAQVTPFPRDNIDIITDSLLLFVAKTYEHAAPIVGTSHRQRLMRDFVALVSKHAGNHRSIPFYAAKLHIVPHYLSTLVKQESGRTVMEWINQAAVSQIKARLAYNRQTVAQIADDMDFPGTAALCKFFKRETGITTSSYRILCRY